MDLTPEEKKMIREALTKQIRFYQEVSRATAAGVYTCFAPEEYARLIAANETLKRKMK